MDNDLNIIEAYLKEFGQMIILLIGMPTSNKSNIAKELELDIEPKFTLININDYFEKKIINVETKNINFKLYDHPDNINYSKLFNDINKVKSTGVILYGNSIDSNKIKDIKIDFSYFFDIKPTFLKNNLINKKKLPFNTPKSDKVLNNIEKSSVNESNTTSTTDNTTSNTNNTVSTTDNTTSTTDNTVSTTDNTTTMNEPNLKNDDDKINLKLEIYIKDILMPMYDNIKKNIKFNKFYNIKEDTKFNDIYDNLFDNLILLIKKKLNQPFVKETETETETETKTKTEN